MRWNYIISSYDKPEPLDPTIKTGPDGHTVSVPTLAWGVHRMLRNLFADKEHMARAEATARALFGD